MFDSTRQQAAPVRRPGAGTATPPSAPTHQDRPVVVVARPLPCPPGGVFSSRNTKAATTAGGGEGTIAAEGRAKNQARNRRGQGKEARPAGLSQGKHVFPSHPARWAYSVHRQRNGMGSMSSRREGGGASERPKTGFYNSCKRYGSVIFLKISKITSKIKAESVTRHGLLWPALAPSWGQGLVEA